MRLNMLLSAVLIAGFAAEAEAHYLWIETSPEKGSARIYYGEYEEGVREQAGGKLDEVTALKVSTENGEAAPEVRREKDHFVLPLGAEPADYIQIEETGREVKDWRQYDIGVVKPMYYASALANPSAAPLKEPGEKTALAVYPVALGPKSKLRVYFMGKPLAGAKLKIHAPNLWSRELKTDESGTAEIELPWPGRYVFEAVQKEAKPGSFGGVAYEAIRHRATFSWDFESGPGS